MDRLKERVFSEIDRTWDEEIEFLKELVRCKSTLFNEAEAQCVMERKLKQMGLTVDKFDIDIKKIQGLPGFSPVKWSYKDRPLIVGVWKSEKSGKGKSLVLNGHMDVVPVESEQLWSHDPWEPVIEGDKMFGRGAGDMKAGHAAVIYAIKALKNMGVKLEGNVIVQSVIEEECTGNGTLACIERGYTGDAAFIAESMGANILIAETGVLWLRVTVTGAAGHVEGVQPSINAIEKAYDVIQALKKMEKEWNSNIHKAFMDMEHPLNFNIGEFKGGCWPSSVPSLSEFTVRFGFNPDVDPRLAQEELESRLRDILLEDDWFKLHMPEFEWFGHRDAGYAIDPQDPAFKPFFDALTAAHNCVSSEKIGFSRVKACTDARFWILDKRIPANCYGAIGGNFHGADEYVLLSSVKRTTKVIASLILDWCNRLD